MTIKSAALIAVVTAFCFACNSNSDSVSSQNKEDLSALNREMDSSHYFQTVDSTNEPQQTNNGNQKNQNDNPPKPIDWDKKIVKDATLNAEVKDYKSFSQQLSDKVKKYGGYVSQEEQSQSDYKIENSVIIKVPVDQFENAVNDLTKDVSKLNEKHITSEDVTTQLVDGKSRLEAKKQVRLRYLDLLKQARNMEEILTVQKEINDIQEDIETVNGRINFLSRSSVMSTINFTFFQVLDPAAKAADEKEATFLSKVKSAFANGWYWIGELFVGLVSIWPLALMTILGIWFFRKRQMPKVKTNSDSSR
jgi:Domain of unknown function (DUF4349)